MKVIESVNLIKIVFLIFEVWREVESREGSCRLLWGDVEESELSDKKNVNLYVSEYSLYL